MFSRKENQVTNCGFITAVKNETTVKNDRPLLRKCVELSQLSK